MLSLPARFIPLFVGVILGCATGCGTSYSTTKIKTYRLSLTDGDQALIPEFKLLIADYNAMAGIGALEYVDNAADANSAIVVTKGLRTQTNAECGRDGCVGLGAPMWETESQSPMSYAPSGHLQRTVTYSMRVEFDWDYMHGMTHLDHQKLFFHEVGHGLELGHNLTDVSDVMYPDVGGDKNMPRYFDYVRSYMADL